MPSLRRLLAPILILAVGTLACDDDVTGPRDPEDVSFDASLGVNLAAMTELDSGIYIQTLVAGQGVPVVEGDLVVVEYTLWLPNGTEVDATEPGQPATFRLDPGVVIDGFRMGMEGMLPGETRLMVIPSALGYGAGGNTGVPPHSVLVFRVKLVDLNPPL